MKEKTKKKIIGALYGIILEKPLNKLHNWQSRLEKKLGFCCYGCENCYKWERCTSEKEGNPYKKYRPRKKK